MKQYVTARFPAPGSIHFPRTRNTIYTRTVFSLISQISLWANARAAICRVLPRRNPPRRVPDRRAPTWLSAAPQLRQVPWRGCGTYLCQLPLPARTGNRPRTGYCNCGTRRHCRRPFGTSARSPLKTDKIKINARVYDREIIRPVLERQG